MVLLVTLTHIPFLFTYHLHSSCYCFYSMFVWLVRGYFSNTQHIDSCLNGMHLPQDAACKTENCLKNHSVCLFYWAFGWNHMYVQNSFNVLSHCSTKYMMLCILISLPLHVSCIQCFWFQNRVQFKLPAIVIGCSYCERVREDN